VVIAKDYRRVNKFCRVPKYQIPNVVEELHKLVSFDIYHDLDLTNAFHQVKKTFQWSDEATWTEDYRGVFESFKGDILNSFTLVHPDYASEWYLYVDASDIAVGGVRIQVTTEAVQQVVAFVSQKFSR
jgi:hypothetical protein